MSFRKIVAPLIGGPRDEVVLASAFAAARPFNAHVVALFVRPDPAEAMPFFGEGMSSTVVQEIVNVAKEAADRAAEIARAALGKTAAGEGVMVLDVPAQQNGVTASFRDVQGNFSDCVSRCARLSDLVVFGPLREAEKPGLTEAFEDTLLGTGRPVLLSALAPPVGFAEKIMLAWDGSLACAHAVSAALPYLSRAKEIEILCVQRTGIEPPSPSELQEYLALHGLTAADRKLEIASKSIGEALLAAAAQGGAKLIVLGGYGHSRLRQLISGGVTRHVVSHATIPLLLMH